MDEFIKPNKYCDINYNRNETEIEAIRNMSEPEVKEYIRNRLRFDRHIEGSLRYRVGDKENQNQHYRFNMHGNYAYNMGILLKFEDLGIFDYYEFLSLRFYKGGGYVAYGNGALGNTYDGHYELGAIYDLHGLGTVEIIYEIFKITILKKL